MKCKSIAWTSLFSLLFFGLNAQELVKINNKSYDVKEFERVYTKNLDLLKDSDQKDIDNYMNLFVLYKLKVDEAYRLGLDNRDTYKNELATHRKQLAEKYFTDEKKLEALTIEAYERSKKEREASHILIAVGLNDSPQDTLKAYKKALSVYQEIQNGKSFADAAVEYSADPSAKHNKGYLGYFSVFRMVYSFEQAAYTTPVGTVSKPVRSQFGYHLVYVTAERPIRYLREVSHLFIDAKKHTSEEAKVLVDEAYAELQNGSNFAEVVKKYSDEANVEETSGFISRYSPGVMDINGFDDQVYKIDQANTYSTPFESEWGWHIVYVGKINPYPTFEESKTNIQHRVATDTRSQVLKEDLQRHLKERFHYKENAKELEKSKKLITETIYKGEWKVPSKVTSVIATFADQEVQAEDFMNYVEKNSASANFTPDIEQLRNQLYDGFINKTMLKYYDDRLEQDFPEFHNTMQEYREGLLLFDLMEQEIWNKVKSDSLGYTAYYNENKQNYKTPASFDGIIAEYKTLKEAKKALKLFNKKKDINTTLNTVQPHHKKEQKHLLKSNVAFNNINASSVQTAFIKEDDNKYEVVYVSAFYPEKDLELEQVKGRVIQEYQDQYEKKWVDSLEKNAQIHINQEHLHQLKQKYSQE